jgi:hypothetical protein
MLACDAKGKQDVGADAGDKKRLSKYIELQNMWHHDL